MSSPKLIDRSLLPVTGGLPFSLGPVTLQLPISYTSPACVQTGLPLIHRFSRARGILFSLDLVMFQFLVSQPPSLSSHPLPLILSFSSPPSPSFLSRASLDCIRGKLPREELGYRRRASELDCLAFLPLTVSPALPPSYPSFPIPNSCLLLWQ